MIDSRDTIAAIATAPGEAGIGIVRISGKKALAIADKVFKPKNGRKPSTFKTRTIHYGWVIDDEALLTVMRSPKSFTREDVVEINRETLIHKTIKRLSKKLFVDIGLQHVARFDFRVDGDDIYFLEINPLPGMMEGSLYPKMLRASGYGVEDVIVESFKNEIGRQKKATTFRYHID